MQSKLNAYFTITTIHDTKHKKCFIYDPQNRRAFYDYSPDKTDIFVTEKLKYKLYYRPLTTTAAAEDPFHSSLPPITTSASVSLLKSNLQKGVRRCNVEISILTSLALLQKDPIEFLRRLPIIYVEDVCVMEHFPIPVWLMMADKEYKINNYDIVLLLAIVHDLCLCMQYREHKNTAGDYYENESELEHNNCLLALFCRSKYGGMKGDMNMLKNAVHEYLENPHYIVKDTWGVFGDAIRIVNNNMDKELYILPEAIDFHPFPTMVTFLQKKTGCTEQEIKEAIWNAESRVNYRKPHAYKDTNNACWNMITPYLDDARYNALRMQYVGGTSKGSIPKMIFTKK
jgi:hypothetical protein